MIDLVLQNATRTALGLWALNLKLVVNTPEGDYTEAHGIRWVWWGGGRLREERPDGSFAWGGTGKFPKTLGPPPTYAAGVVAIVGISVRFFIEDGQGNKTYDGLTPDPNDPERDEQWARSRIARYIRNNGTPGSMAGIPHWEVDGTKLRRYSDVQVFLDANGLPGHTWQGGNQR